MTSGRPVASEALETVLDGLLADEGTEFWKFCFDMPEIRQPDDPAHLDFVQSAYAHVMGRVSYEAIAASSSGRVELQYRRHRQASGRNA
jgi:hypothetical protein